MKHAANGPELGLRRNCGFSRSNMSFVVSLMRLHFVRSGLSGVSVITASAFRSRKETNETSP
jgi:hypothetical protein